MFQKICKHCGCPLSYYKNRESAFGCRINVIEGYGYYVGRHEYELEIFSIFRNIFCGEKKNLE